MEAVKYASEIDLTQGTHKVVFLNEKGERLVRAFPSPYLAEDFARKINHSKRCQLVSVMRWF